MIWKTEMWKKRIKTCHECPHLRESIMQCKECGCFVHAKAAVKHMTCPLGKWDTEFAVS